MAQRDLLLEDGVDEKQFHDTKTISAAKKKRSGVFFEGEAEIRNQRGELLFTRKNVILVGGRRFALEKLFGITPDPLNAVRINDILGVNTAEQALTGAGPRRESIVCLFGVGTGGSNLTFGSVRKPISKNYNLFNAIPVRYVDADNDLSKEEQEQYFMRRVEGDKVAYYLKGFEAVPTLIMKQGDQTFHPQADGMTENTDTTNVEDVDVYAEIRLKISAEDVREYFIANEGLDQARINELSLYFGYKPESTDPDAYVDYAGVEAFSKLTFNNQPLDDETTELNIIYRIYI